ncbi:BZ3500_MvSof-1268-A1-R1_Chr3-1g05871 [Microbotryum saponariae]|uniref:BZ3500_MvSof-1268-A1-R1_Chr3-1g05871 protein n=1 Tax=Microbotryum saponariae TaxID=289078 RepID=A0A2X0L1A5_9BASI|nr:BZ3500_MvSof-1268-A1-R1_Chr3-1g05871 [Microbotryum saponariae]SDA05061.1 BZ3501_MvSof-1269-A2-R1_Chr3-1g05541 [Microbotryum saponariae]
MGRQPLVIGKPEAAMLESILKTYDLDKSKMLMVGDRLNTDILFGVNGGISTMLVLTGINTRAEAEAEDAVAKPTYIVDSLGDFLSVV